MPRLRSAETAHRWRDTRALLGGVEGHLADREAEWLYFAAATCRAEGEVVEVGSFKGKSAICLAKGVEVSGSGGRVIAIDPHCAPAPTDPELRGAHSSEPEMKANLARAGVADLVDVRVQYSGEVARTWQSPIRLLWLDGDHTLEGVQADFDCWTPHLSEGGLLAMHDVLHRFEGPASVFLQHVLRSPGWAGIGFVKSIGFARKAAAANLTGSRRTRLQAALLGRMATLSRRPERRGAFGHRLLRAIVLRV